MASCKATVRLGNDNVKENICKNCIKADVCVIAKEFEKEPVDEMYIEGCDYFKDRNRFVELPCRVGDVVYSYCEELYRILPYFIEQIIISYDSDSPNNEYITFNGISSNSSELLAEIDFTVDEIGKTVFLTREEAERVLKNENWIVE